MRNEKGAIGETMQEGEAKEMSEQRKKMDQRESK
jgi:hypothetical protein